MRRWEKEVVVASTGTICRAPDKDGDYDDDDNNDDDDLFAGISILLEGNLPSTVKHFEFEVLSTTTPPPSSSTSTTTTSLAVVMDDKFNTTETKGLRQATTRRRRAIHVALHVVDDDPGSIRSGHYLWNAAPSLCEYLIRRHYCHCYQSQQPHDCHQKQLELLAPRSIIELGAGCSLPSLVALQLYVQSLQCLIISDHDPTVLERARDSYESTMKKLIHKQTDGNDVDDHDEREDNCCLDQLGSIPVAFETLEWGRHNHKHHHRKQQQHNSFLDGSPKIKNHLLLSSSQNQRQHSEKAEEAKISHDPDDDDNTVMTIDLILGSDLIDCIEIVEPLFHTAYDLMHDESIFILSQSFLYDTETETKIQTICNDLLLEQSIRYDNLSTIEEEEEEEMPVSPPKRDDDDTKTNIINQIKGVNIFCTSNANNETRTILPKPGRYRIQEFKRR